jgi:hypothetical protein
VSLSPSEPLADDAAHNRIKAVPVIHRVVFGRAIVVPKYLFIEIAEKMKRFDTHIGSLDAALEQAPEVFKAVGMNTSIDIFEGMVDNLVLVLLGHLLVGHEGVGIDGTALSDMLDNLALQIVAAASGNHGGANLFTTVKQSHNGSLSGDASRAQMLTPSAIRVHVTSLATDESFIHFDFRLWTAELNQRSALQCKPDAMEHEPCGSLSDFQGTPHFIATDSVLAVSEHPSCSEPLVERNGTILKDRSDLNGELAPGMMASALPSAAVGVIARLFRSAAGANDAVRPAAYRKVLSAILWIREVNNRLLKALWLAHCLVLHRPNVL